MKNKDLNKQFEAFKRQAVDVVRDMHARKLAIPAAALLFAIAVAIVMLPQGASAPPAPPAAAAPVVQPKVERVAQVSLIEPSTLGEDIPVSNSEDPFAGSDGGYKCTKVSSSPKSFDCLVADLKVRIICTAESTTGPCAAASTAGATGGGSGGSTSSTGSGGGSGSGSTGTTGTPSTPGGGNSNGGSGGKKTAYYTVTVSIDGTTKKNVVAGDELPKSIGALAVYAGTNDAHTKGVFIASDGVTVSGVTTDATFGSFSLKKGQTATLTDVNGAEHKLTLKKITRATK
jgi:hypothetical protein